MLSFAVTILFGGSIGDALTTLAMGLAIQPALERIERSDLPPFFQIVFGVSATVLLLGAAIAGAASLVLGFGESLDVQLQITTAGRIDWPALVIVAAGSTSVACYACRVGVPRRTLLSVVGLGALAVVLAQGLTPLSSDLSHDPRTLLGSV